jgi:hypothetical protein
MTAEEIMQEHLCAHCFERKGCYEACIEAIKEFAKYHLEKYKEYLLQEGDKYTTNYPINQKVTTLIININKLNSYNIK